MPGESSKEAFVSTEQLREEIDGLLEQLHDAVEQSKASPDDADARAAIDGLKQRLTECTQRYGEMQHAGEAADSQALRIVVAHKARLEEGAGKAVREATFRKGLPGYVPPTAEQSTEAFLQHGSQYDAQLDEKEAEELEEDREDDDDAYGDEDVVDEPDFGDEAGIGLPSDRSSADAMIEAGDRKAKLEVHTSNVEQVHFINTMSQAVVDMAKELPPKQHTLVIDGLTSLIRRTTTSGTTGIVPNKANPDLFIYRMDEKNTLDEYHAVASTLRELGDAITDLYQHVMEQIHKAN